MTTIAAVGRNSGPLQGQSVLNFLESIDLQPSLLAGNATFTSPVIDLGASPGYSRWRVLVFSDQVGTANLQQSSDGITFYTTIAQSYGAGGQAAVIESLVAMRYLQLSYVNGASAQGSFRAVATLVAV